MGEAKRRRQLDPNYGQTQIPEQFKDIFHDFVNKQIDIAIMSPKCLLGSGLEQGHQPNYKSSSMPQQAIIPISPMNNFARGIFLECQSQIMPVVIPQMEQYGKGWIGQVNNSTTCEIGIVYFPATTSNLQSLQQQVFTRSLGKMVASIIKCALSNWHFQPDNIHIPVVAMSSNDNEPSYLFCL